MRPWLLLLVTLGFAIRVTPPASAATLPAPNAPVRALAAGEEVVTPVPPLPAGIEELELLLVPERGPAVRVSRELPAGTTAIRWRVPAIASRSARLVLRAGGEAREIESAPSAAFALAPLPAAELDRARRGRSDAGHALASLAGAVRPRSLRAPDDAIAPARTLAHAVESSAPALFLPRATTRAFAPAAGDPPAPLADPHVLARSPEFTPLRN